MHLKGKKAFVTGGTEGIGAAIVTQLVARGAEVVTCARHEPGQLPGPRVSFRRCDLASAADREALIAWLVSTHPDLAVLVNNAAVQHALDFMQAGLTQIQAAASLELALNLEAPIMLSAGLLPLLATRIPGLCPWSARLRLLLTVLWSRVAWLWAWVARLWLLLA